MAITVAELYLALKAQMDLGRHELQIVVHDSQDHEIVATSYSGEMGNLGPAFLIEIEA